MAIGCNFCAATHKLLSSFQARNWMLDNVLTLADREVGCGFLSQVGMYRRLYEEEVNARRASQHTNVGPVAGLGH